MSKSMNTRLTPAENYDVENMVFSEAVSGSIPDSKVKIEFKRINITTKNEDGTEGELVIPTERLFSYGVSENTSQETGKVNGYTFPLCLWTRSDAGGPTKGEKAWTDTFNNIVDRCIRHLLDNKEELDLFDLTKSDLVRSKGGLNPLYWKKEKHTNKQGKTVLRVVPGSGPTLYTKLIFSKKHNKFLSQMYDLNDEPVNVLDLLGKYCYTNAAVKIESIFIGSKISLQVKLYEAVVEPTQSGMKRLLSRPKARSKVLAMKNNSTVSDALDNDDEDDEGSLVESEEEEVQKPVVKKKTVRKVRKVKKVARN